MVMQDCRLSALKKLEDHPTIGNKPMSKTANNAAFLDGYMAKKAEEMGYGSGSEEKNVCPDCKDGKKCDKCAEGGKCPDCTEDKKCDSCLEDLGKEAAAQKPSKLRVMSKLLSGSMAKKEATAPVVINDPAVNSTLSAKLKNLPGE